MTKWALIKEETIFSDKTNDFCTTAKYILTAFDTLDEAYYMLESLCRSNDFNLEEKTFSGYKMSFKNEQRVYIREIEYPIEKAREKFWDDLTLLLFEYVKILKDIDKNRYKKLQEKVEIEDSFTIASYLVSSYKVLFQMHENAFSHFMEKDVFPYFRQIREKNKTLIPELLRLQNEYELIKEDNQNADTDNR